MEKISHIYNSVIYRPDLKIRFLCSDEYIDAELEDLNRDHANLGYKIDNIHQWSLGAGHNANCPDCLIKFARYKIKSDYILLEKILNIAEKKDNSFRNYLTKREIQIFKLIVEGKTMNEISEELFISPKTVENHKYNIMQKLNAKNTVELVKIYMRENI